jgi:hypothetical protein
LPTQLERGARLRPLRDLEGLRPVEGRHLDLGAQRGLRDVDRDDAVTVLAGMPAFRR